MSTEDAEQQMLQVLREYYPRALSITIAPLSGRIYCVEVEHEEGEFERFFAPLPAS